MAVDEKIKIGFFALAVVIFTFFVFNYRDKVKVVEIIYFRKTSCVIVNNTDKIIEEVRSKFGDNVRIQTIDLDSEGNLTEEEVKLKDKYEVVGVPEIIINGKEYTEEFTKEILERRICSSFIIRPRVCG